MGMLAENSEITAGAAEGMRKGPGSGAAREKTQVSPRRAYLFFKRVQDILFSALAMVVLMPFMLVIAAIIVIDDPRGGPIYRQTRCGKDGREFTFYKFRSMCVDADQKLAELLKDNEMDGPAFKLKNDPRVTRVGRFIRKYSIDELPQLFNVLKGDMSIVGPRPPLPREVAQYNDYQMQRLSIKPGLTCYWQTQPDRNSLSFDQWVAYDLAYIQNRSFLTDWKLIIKTIWVVFHP